MSFATGLGSIPTFASPSVTRTTFLSPAVHVKLSDARRSPSQMFVQESPGISCRTESVVTFASIVENASISVVSGLTRNGFPANITSQNLSPSRFATKFASTLFAASSRLGERSSASIDLEMSNTNTMSVHSFFSVCLTYGYLGSAVSMDNETMMSAHVAARKTWRKKTPAAFVSRESLTYLQNLASRRSIMKTGTAARLSQRASGLRNSIAMFPVI